MINVILRNHYNIVKLKKSFLSGNKVLIFISYTYQAVKEEGYVNASVAWQD